MNPLRLIFALHNHQPVGNFDGVFEAAYRDSYRPFLDVMEDYPDIPFVLHTSGPLLEWLAGHEPGYVARVRRLVESGQVEVLGGPFFEPVLTMIPHRDRVGQVRAYSEYLHELLGAKVRGAWVPERVWEQGLVSSLVEAGVEYTVLDDAHFESAGLTPDQLHGYYLTEDDGRLLKVFAGSERLRYLVPFRDPHECYEELRAVAARRPGATVVCADDGEKFGSWPRTYDHVFNQGWLRRFCDMLRGNRDWLMPTTFAEAVDSTLPLGKVYLPDGSYREMTEWSLPAGRLDALRGARASAPGSALLPFARAGGSWRNFKAKYPESDAMYCRMLGVSRRLQALAAWPDADPDYLAAARDELYRGQCNCSYWHGSFGGLYLPHLRNAVYRHLIAADNALDDAEGKDGPRAALDVGDFNLDARQEVRMENDRIVAFVGPACGGHVYELDVRQALTNVLNTLDRRPEPYHADVAEPGASGASGAEPVVHKQGGLERLLVYDKHPRKAFVDHFFADGATLDDLTAGRDVERGDFVTAAYFARAHREAGAVRLTMERTGSVEGHPLLIKKVMALAAGSPTLDVAYTLEGLPPGVHFTFAVEVNHAGMAGHAEDRYYADGAHRRLGMLDTCLDLSGQSGLSLTDEWLDLRVGLEWSRPADVWAFPVATVSRSEGGYEAVYQSSAVLPRWRAQGDEAGRWEVRLRWSFGPCRASADAGALGTRQRLAGSALGD